MFAVQPTKPPKRHQARAPAHIIPSSPCNTHSMSNTTRAFLSTGGSDHIPDSIHQSPSIAPSSPKSPSINPHIPKSPESSNISPQHPESKFRSLCVPTRSSAGHDGPAVIFIVKYHFLSTHEHRAPHIRHPTPPPFISHVARCPADEQHGTHIREVTGVESE